MIWRNIIIGGAAVAIGNGLAVGSDGQVSPMVSSDLTVTPQGQVEYVVPLPESGARGSVSIRRHDEGDE